MATTATRVVVEEDLAPLCGGECPLVVAPVGAVADWLEEDGQSAAAKMVRELFC